MGQNTHTQIMIKYDWSKCQNSQTKNTRKLTCCRILPAPTGCIGNQPAPACRVAWGRNPAAAVAAAAVEVPTRWQQHTTKHGVKYNIKTN